MACWKKGILLSSGPTVVTLAFIHCWYPLSPKYPLNFPFILLSSILIFMPTTLLIDHHSHAHFQHPIPSLPCMHPRPSNPPQAHHHTYHHAFSYHTSCMAYSLPLHRAHPCDSPFFIIPMTLFPLYPHAFFIPILILTTYCAHVLPSSLLIEEVPKPKEMCQSPRLFSVSLLRKGQVNHAKVFKASKWFSGLNWLFLYSQVHQTSSPMKIWAVLIDLGLGFWT